MIVELLFFVFIVGVIVVILAYFGDRFEREPLFRIFNAIVLGIAATLIVVVVKRILPLPAYSPNPGFGNIVLVNFLSVGFVEEMSKFFMILYFVYRWEDFNEFYDGPLYAGLVGIGFAMSENLAYLIKPLAGMMASGIAFDPNQARLIALNVLVKFRLYPGHFLFGFIAGYFVAKAKFAGENRDSKKIVCLGFGFFLAIVMHGIYNSIALLGTIALFQAYVVFLFFIAVFVGWKSRNKSFFRKEFLAKLPLQKSEMLKDVLRIRKEEKITVGYIAMLCILVLVVQFMVYFLSVALFSL